MIGRMHHVVLDCQDPAALAAFYSELLGLPVTYASPDWVVVATSDRASGLAFQLAPDHRAPTWPDPAIPQQVHLDVMVDDIEAAARQVLELGATRLPGTKPGEPDVYADPAGHPFCLVRRPHWAEPITAGGSIGVQETVEDRDHVVDVRRGQDHGLAPDRDRDRQRLPPRS